MHGVIAQTDSFNCLINPYLTQFRWSLHNDIDKNSSEHYTKTHRELEITFISLFC